MAIRNASFLLNEKSVHLMKSAKYKIWHLSEKKKQNIYI